MGIFATENASYHQVSSHHAINSLHQKKILIFNTKHLNWAAQETLKRGPRKYLLSNFK